jgi:hypothetical protein
LLVLQSALVELHLLRHLEPCQQQREPSLRSVRDTLYLQLYSFAPWKPLDEGKDFYDSSVLVRKNPLQVHSSADMLSIFLIPQALSQSQEQFENNIRVSVVGFYDAISPH